MAEAQFVQERREGVMSTHKILRNTYMLLSMTLLWSAAMAGASMAMGVDYMGFLPLLLAFGLIFAISKLQNSVWGLVLVFVFTGVLGFALGPVINMYLQTAGGTQTVVTALSLTGMIFLSLSGYTLISKKDFSFMSGFLTVGLWVVIGCIVIAFVGSWMGYQVSALSLAISAAVVILMSGFILYDTSRILHGGETNYIMATVSLYLSIYNLFVHLLVLTGFMSDD